MTGTFDKIKDGRWRVYFLKCEGGFYYCGISKHIIARLNQHNKGKGARVTRDFHPAELVGVWDIGYMSYEKAQNIEDEFTRYFMSVYGDKVYGGRWADRQKHNLAKILRKGKIDTELLTKYRKVPVTYSFKERKLKNKHKKPKRGQPARGGVRDGSARKRCSKTRAFKLDLYHLHKQQAGEKLLEWWEKGRGITNATIEEAIAEVSRRGFYQK